MKAFSSIGLEGRQLAGLRRVAAKTSLSSLSRWWTAEVEVDGWQERSTEEASSACTGRSERSNI